MNVTSWLSRSICIALFLFFIQSCQANVTQTQSAPLILEDREPEAVTGVYSKGVVTSQKFMVVAANPYASQAGFNILNKGGSAVDAAIAVQLVLTLVEPQSSGIGGGAFILHWDEKQKKLITYDGRETAPKAITADLFLKPNGDSISWRDAIVGGRSVGAPGVLSALKKAHDKYGKRPWAELFTDAINLAENGFVVSPRLAKLIKLRLNPGMTTLPNISNYFYPNGEAVKAGKLLQNRKLAKVYRSLAQEGIDAFYKGWIAKSMINAVQHSSVSPGKLSLEDLQSYQAIEREAVCGKYHVYKVCGMGPPSSGGITVIQTLAMLESFKLSQYHPNSLDALHLFTQSSRLAFADRSQYLADSDFVSVPVQGLLSLNYVQARSALISLKKDMGKAKAGTPELSNVQGEDNAYERPSTTHVSIVDADGNALSMTSSVEMAFGSAVMVEGFILNNQLTDFSFQPNVNGKLVANRVAPLKRPRSSMAPMMVFNEDESLKLVLGSPGGSRIINYVTQTIIGVLDWKLTAQEAVNLPHITNRNGSTTLEADTAIIDLNKALQARGHKVKVKGLNSGLHAIEIDKNRVLQAGVDERREGLALGR